MAPVPGKEVGLTGFAWEDEGAHGGLMNRRSNTSCLTDEEIEEFLFNRLSGVTREAVEEHLLVCQTCLDRVEKEEEYVNASKAAARVIESEDLERAYSGLQRQGKADEWKARLARWFGAGRTRSLSFAVASIAVIGVATLFQVRVGQRDRIQEVALELHRGPLVSARASSGVELRLNIQAEDLPPGQYRMELVDASGELLQWSHGTNESGKLLWQLNKSYPAGNYWVRLRQPDSGGKLVREYGLVLR